MKYLFKGLWLFSIILLFSFSIAARVGGDQPGDSISPGDKFHPGDKGKTVSYSFEGGRFYTSVAVDLDGKPGLEVIAAGQADTGDKNGTLGYIAILDRGESGFRLVAGDRFAVHSRGRSLPTRVRDLKRLDRGYLATGFSMDKKKKSSGFVFILPDSAR